MTFVFHGCGCVSSTKQKDCLCYSSSFQYWKRRTNLTVWDKISLWPLSSDRSTVAVGTFITNLLLCCHWGVGGGRNITKGITKQTKHLLQVHIVARCAAATEYCLLFLCFFPLWGKDKELSIMDSCPWPEDSIMAQHNMFPVYIQQQTKAMPENQFPPTFMNKNLIHLRPCTFTKADKRWV